MRQCRLAAARPADQERETLALVDATRETQTRLPLDITFEVEATVGVALERLHIEFVEIQVVQLVPCTIGYLRRFSAQLLDSRTHLSMVGFDRGYLAERIQRLGALAAGQQSLA